MSGTRPASSKQNLFPARRADHEEPRTQPARGAGGGRSTLRAAAHGGPREGVSSEMPDLK